MNGIPCTSIFAVQYLAKKVVKNAFKQTIKIRKLDKGQKNQTKKYSKASSYTALSYTGLADARFLIGSKIISDTRIYVVKTLRCTF